MHQAGRWSLAPAYDVNPVPEIDRVHMWKTPVSEERGEPSIESVLAVAARFGLKALEAKAILREVFAVLSGWRKAAGNLKLKGGTLEAYGSAFEHPLAEEARRLLKQ